MEKINMGKKDEKGGNRNGRKEVSLGKKIL